MDYIKEFYADDEQITLAALSYLKSHDKKDPKTVFEAAEGFVNAHPANILLRNSLNYLFSSQDMEFSKRCDFLTKQIFRAKKAISSNLGPKLKEGSEIFVYPFNLEMRNILGEVPNARRFKISTVSAGYFVPPKRKEIKVHDDISIREAITSADICLLSPKLVTGRGEGAGIKGMSLCADIAGMHGVPLYLCAFASKLDLVDQHKKYASSFLEAYNHPPEEFKIIDTVYPKEITGMITELGILTPAAFIKEAKKAYPWIL